ncbi:hypothetical protein [Cellulophaga baltica]|uniref:hypothetical protein n=1 Tax=Cellulophaga baltica TaxID=76594 RepID=UPI002494C4FA|nr:hypothetical protein [Cellulophaga baltica]
MSKSKKLSNTGIIIIVIVFVTIFWGLPSMVRGKGFMNGILENIIAVLYLGGIAIVGFVIFKIFVKK